MPNRSVIGSLRDSSSVFEDSLHPLVRVFAPCFCALCALLDAQFKGKKAFL